MSQNANFLRRLALRASALVVRVLGVACLVTLPGWAMAASSTDLNELRKLVDAGQYEAAFKLGAEAAGTLENPHFDFLFGIAAINSGHFAQGVLAMERHLLSVPANDRARLELAKGYYELGDTLRARREFEFVLRYNPPKEVQLNIQRYLDAMQSKDVLTSKASSRAYAEIGMGRDNNVNAGTYNTQIDLITGPVLISDPASRAEASSFLMAAAGNQWVRRVDGTLAVFLGADLDGKSNATAHSYDTLNVSLYTGFSVGKGPGFYRLTLSDGHMRVDKEKYRNSLALTGEGQYSLGQGQLLTAVAQYSELAHTVANSVRDARMLTLGGGIQKTFQAAWRPTLGLQVTLTKEANLHLRDDLSRDLWAERLSMSFSPSEQLSISTGLSFQQSRYSLSDIAFGTVRDDKTLTFDLGMSYQWSRDVLIRTSLQRTDNQSTQGLYDYRRTLLGLHTRYLF